MQVRVLLSGGIDSACCVHFYKHAGHNVSAVFMDYGHSVRLQEENSAKRIAKHFAIPLNVVRSSGPPATFEGEIAGRNAFFLFACVLHAHGTDGLIAMGIHAGTSYYDCSEHFLDHSNALLSGYSDGKLALAAPFLHWSKQALYKYCSVSGVPIELTWSCEIGPTVPCGRCLSCEDRAHLNVCKTK